MSDSTPNKHIQNESATAPAPSHVCNEGICTACGRTVFSNGGASTGNAPAPDKSACACGHEMRAHDLDDECMECECKMAAPAPSERVRCPKCETAEKWLAERTTTNDPQANKLFLEVAKFADKAEAEVEREHKRATEPPVVTRELARAREGRDKAEARVATLEAALREIADPVKFMRGRAEAAGDKLEPIYARMLSEDHYFLKSIARAALEAK